MLGRPFTLATVAMPPSIGRVVKTLKNDVGSVTRSPPNLTLMGESGAYDHMLVITEYHWNGTYAASNDSTPRCLKSI